VRTIIWAKLGQGPRSSGWHTCIAFESCGFISWPWRPRVLVVFSTLRENNTSTLLFWITLHLNAIPPYLRRNILILHYKGKSVNAVLKKLSLFGFEIHMEFLKTLCKQTAELLRLKEVVHIITTMLYSLHIISNSSLARCNLPEMWTLQGVGK
jgi:hypothetical protein